jgi:hypothetical protein
VNQYEAPGFSKERYNCPHCGAFSQMHRYDRGATALGKEEDKPVPNSYFIYCESCNGYQIWMHMIDHTKQMIYPAVITVPLPSQDMPDAAKIIYGEAREICRNSPRAATALLRMCVEVICKGLGDEKKSLNDNIGILVKKGLLLHTQQALDGLRVMGNEAVHPGLIDNEDTLGTAQSLFPLVNIIVDQMITQPKLAKDIFDTLPAGAREARSVIWNCSLNHDRRSRKLKVNYIFSRPIRKSCPSQLCAPMAAPMENM